MYNSLVNSRPRENQEGAIQLKGFPFGLNTSVPAEMLSAQELSNCVDLKINPGGQLETRRPFRRYTTTPTTGKVKGMVNAVLSGTQYSLASDDLGNIYYLDDTDFVLIDTLTSGQRGFLFPYNDICFVLDGGHAKYLKDVTELRMTYDAGDTGTQYNELTGNEAVTAEFIAFGNTNTRAAVKFTSDSWASGFTLPITQVDVKLLAEGSPTGVITCKLRKVSDDSVMASKDFSEDASDIAAEGAVYTVLFNDTDITTEMETETDYYCSIEYSDGDASNYLKLVCHESGDAGYSYDGSWSAESIDPLMKVYPEPGPKASFGCVSKNRPWLSGDPDNPGYVWFGNLSAFDYSSELGGGYISTVDENRNSYPVGAIADLYGDLWVYGTQEFPFLCKLQGSAPANFSLPLSFQTLWATRDTLVNVGNDLWNGTLNGVDSISGVQSYGDIRMFSQSDRINNIIKKYWSEEAFSGFYPKDGQYWLKLPNYDNILIANLRAKFKDPETGLLSYPWCEYSVPEGVSISSMGYIGKDFYLGTEDGHLYSFSATEYKDHINNAEGEAFIWPEFTTSYLSFPFRTVDLEQIYVVADSITGGQFKVDFYIDGLKANSVLSELMQIAINDSLTIDELTMAIDDMYFSIDSATMPLWKYLNINCWSVMIKISEIYIIGDPIYFNECIIPYERKEK